MNNKDIIISYSRRLWEKRDLSAIDDTFEQNAMIYSPLNAYRGSITMREIAQKWLSAFPDLAIEWQDFITEGTKVVSRWRARGTHLGSFFETSPTHYEVSYSGVVIYTLNENHKVQEYWALVDMHAILSQLKVFSSISEVIE